MVKIVTENQMNTFVFNMTAILCIKIGNNHLERLDTDKRVILSPYIFREAYYELWISISVLVFAN